MCYYKIVWIIDDDAVFNDLTEKTMKMYHFSAEVRAFTNSEVAVEELMRAGLTGSFPDIIFLDLNMPGLDGWDVLNVYRDFPSEVKQNCILYILSSSINEDDINKSMLYEDVRDFLSKPLRKMDMEVIKFQSGREADAADLLEG